jgi:flagella basal body P-ring formation protein FlgA
MTISSTGARGAPLIVGMATAAWLATAGTVHAGVDVTDPAVISRAAMDAVRSQAGDAAGILHLTAQPTDHRLRLPICSQALAAHVAGDGRLRQHVAVDVRCEGSARWSVFVSITVESDARVLVARRSLPSGAEPVASDFEPAVRRVAGLANDYVGDAGALAGRRLRRTLAPGDALILDALEAANLVHRGQEVVLLARIDGIEVRVNGIALADGRQADRIRVQNLSSQRVVEGVVRSDSVVEAPL